MWAFRVLENAISMILSVGEASLKENRLTHIFSLVEPLHFLTSHLKQSDRLISCTSSKISSETKLSVPWDLDHTYSRLSDQLLLGRLS
jgi:hypothetical protein